MKALFCKSVRYVLRVGRFGVFLLVVWVMAASYIGSNKAAPRLPIVMEGLEDVNNFAALECTRTLKLSAYWTRDKHGRRKLIPQRWETIRVDCSCEDKKILQRGPIS